MLGQQYHEKILRSHLEKMGTVVEFGSELKGFEQFEDHVTVQIVHRSHGEESLEEIAVPWLVGTDGAHSVVRKTLALSFLGETREADQMVIGDIKVKAGLDDHEVREIVFEPSFIQPNPFLCSIGRNGPYPQACTVKCRVLPHFTYISI